MVLKKVGFLDGSVGKESACNAGDLDLTPGSGKSPRGGHSNPLPVFLSGESHGQRTLVGYHPWGHWELDTTENGNVRIYFLGNLMLLLGKEMFRHSSLSSNMYYLFFMWNTMRRSSLKAGKWTTAVVLKHYVLSHVWLFETLWTVDSLPGSSVHGDSPGKNTGVGCHVLLQGIFPTHVSEPRSSTLQSDSLPTEPPGINQHPNHLEAYWNIFLIQ